MSFYSLLNAAVAKAVAYIKTETPQVVYPYAADSTGEPTPLESSSAGLKVDASGALPPGAATDAGGSAYVRSSAAERYHTVLGAACTLTSVRVYNSGAAKLYLVVVDQVAAPTTGVTACFPLCEVDAGAAEIWTHSESCTLGCHVCLSTAPLVYTDPGAVGYFAAWRV